MVLPLRQAGRQCSCTGSGFWRTLPNRCGAACPWDDFGAHGGGQRGASAHHQQHGGGAMVFITVEADPGISGRRSRSCRDTVFLAGFWIMALLGVLGG